MAFTSTVLSLLALVPAMQFISWRSTMETSLISSPTPHHFESDQFISNEHINHGIDNHKISYKYITHEIDNG